MNEVNANKIKIEIFIPSGKCTCTYSQWVQKIWDKLDDYREYVEVETTDTNSQRAKELRITGQTLLVNNEKTLLFYLKDKLVELIKEFNLKQEEFH